jgi:hypothetical protein
VGYLGKRDIYAILLIIISGLGCFFLGILYERDTNVPDVRLSQIPVNTNTASVYSPSVKSSVNTKAINSLGETVKKTASEAQTSVTSSNAVSNGQYVASKNSNKFHLPTCPGAKQISEANKIWFQTKAEAIAKGYIPASNCNGI